MTDLLDAEEVRLAMRALNDSASLTRVEVAELRTENARLREALRALLNTAYIEAYDHATTQLIVLDEVLQQARDALND